MMLQIYYDEILMLETNILMLNYNFKKTVSMLIIFLVNFLNGITGLQHSMTIGIISCMIATKCVIELKKLAQRTLLRSRIYGVCRNGKSLFSVAFCGLNIIKTAVTWEHRRKLFLDIMIIFCNVIC